MAFKIGWGRAPLGRRWRFADGRTGADLWNLYPRLYTDAYYRFATERRPEALTFSRAGFAGSQTAPAHWAGDENSTWEAFRHSILAGLSAGISGILFWGWDLGGFSGPLPSAELYLRATAMAAFCPIMQYHSEYQQYREPALYRTPWNVQALTGDHRVIPFFRHFVNLRHNLMPYLWREAQFSAQSGQPMLRTLFRPQVAPYQYFLGRDLLVCPVVEPGRETWPCALPPGEWADLWTGTRYSGDQVVTLAAPLDRIPVFVRAGAQIPVAMRQEWGEAVPLSATPTRVLTF
ncbi:MAG: glycoside hydrolase family 31 protein [Anaerolineae bacterium]|nr:glycoside hydrolase family 31 protein [Anaerolineae bacterium]